MAEIVEVLQVGDCGSYSFASETLQCQGTKTTNLDKATLCGQKLGFIKENGSMYS